MLRDIRERVQEFLTNCPEYTVPEFEVVPIALTTAQVVQYNPPPNPAKLTDPRAKWYVAKCGDMSWEVDALRPDIMIKLVNEAVARFVDVMKLNAIKSKEKSDTEIIEDFAKTITGENKIRRVEPYKFDRDDLRTKVALMRIIHNNVVDNDDGSEPFFGCPICGMGGAACDMDTVFAHIFDDHAETEFRALVEGD
jgi:hypothetical protein